MTVEQLWREEAPRVRAFLLRNFSEADADDLLADAFEAILREERQGKPISGPRLWSRVTFLMLRGTPAEDVDLWGRPGSASSFPTTEVALFRAAFDQALGQLADDERAAFALTELRGLSTREAADLLGVSAMTVSRAAQRARTTLRKELS